MKFIRDLLIVLVILFVALVARELVDWAVGTLCNEPVPTLEGCEP